MFQADFSQAGNAAAPSPSIWKDCAGRVLEDQGLGYYFHEDFYAGTTNFADGVGVGGQAGLEIDADTGTTIAKASGAGGILANVVSNTDNNASALFAYPFGPLTLNSGRKMWAEARFNIGTLGDGDYGFFFGFAAEAVLNRDVVADDVASVAAGLANDSLYGFTIQKDNVGKVYAVVKKDTTAVQTVFSDVTNNAALGTAGVFTITSGTFLKLGMRFDGKKTLRFFVNGVEIGHYTLLSTDVGTDNLGPIFCFKTGTTTARTFNIDWIRAALQTRN